MGDIYQPTTDAEYNAWVEQHPKGFVLKVPHSVNEELVWHQVGCGHIMPFGDLSYVERAGKACSVHPGALAAWAKSQPHKTIHCCIHCRGDWAKEYGN